MPGRKVERIAVFSTEYGPYCHMTVEGSREHSLYLTKKQALRLAECLNKAQDMGDGRIRAHLTLPGYVWDCY